MQVRTTSLAGVVVFVPTPHRDHRGFFTRTFDATVAAAHGVDPASFLQDSQSLLRPGCPARAPHPGRAGRGQARAVRPGCDSRRGGGRPRRVALVRPSRGLPARRRAVLARVHPFWPAARLPGAERRRRRLLPDRQGARP
jgi:hypothetical protein